MNKKQLDLQRPSPPKSATLFSVGAKRPGNDGRMWIVLANKNGVKRWAQTDRSAKPVQCMKTKLIAKKSAGSQKKSSQSKPTGKLKQAGRGLAYQKSGIEWIKLNKKQFKKIIFNEYEMSHKKSDRAKLAADLKEIVTAWEALTGRNQDMSDERIADSSIQELKKSIEWYVTKDGLSTLVPWLGDLLLLSV